MEAPTRFELVSEGFADLCLTTWPWRLKKNGAEDGARTRHLRLGKAALYQMNYSRMVIDADERI